MARPEALVRAEIAATIERAGFDGLVPDMFVIELPERFTRKLGDCRPLGEDEVGDSGSEYRLRVARRLFEADDDEAWRETVRHEVAHAHVFERFGTAVDPHGDAWRSAARRAGATPSACVAMADAHVEPNYVLACPDGCFERPYLRRSRRIRRPWQYVCSACEAALCSFDAEGRPATLEPGRCYVTSLRGERR